MDGSSGPSRFRPRNRSTYIGEASGWYSPFMGNSYDFTRRGVRLQDARTTYFYLRTLTSPQLVRAKVGEGSELVMAVTDDQGRYFDGSKSYRLQLPSNIPAKEGWSLVVYDPQTRSMLQTPRSSTPALRGPTRPPPPAPDGPTQAALSSAVAPTTVYFGPNPPSEQGAAWIQTVPGKGWFVILRLYGPMKSWFDESWRPGELESIESL